jgi:hypothetical protein
VPRSNTSALDDGPVGASRSSFALTATGTTLAYVSAWQSIRLLRSHPPHLAQGDKDRTEVFTAALEQSEQLMRAAEGMGYASKPLPLFYSLSQAGRAIAAARLDDPAWRLRGHGLAVGDSENPITETVITSQPMSEKNKLKYGRTDSFAGVSAAVGSAVLSLEAKVKLGEVWAAVPDLLPGLVQRMYGLGIDHWRRPRVVYDEYEVETNDYVRWRGTSPTRPTATIPITRSCCWGPIRSRRYRRHTRATSTSATITSTTWSDENSPNSAYARTGAASCGRVELDAAPRTTAPTAPQPSAEACPRSMTVHSATESLRPCPPPLANTADRPERTFCPRAG